MIWICEQARGQSPKEIFNLIKEEQLRETSVTILLESIQKDSKFHYKFYVHQWNIVFRDVQVISSHRSMIQQSNKYSGDNILFITLFTRGNAWRSHGPMRYTRL